MTILFWTVLILIIIVITLFISELCDNSNIFTEHWQDYMTLPFDYISTGSSPISFYRKDLYREPYDYPYKFFTSYPVPSMQYHALL